MSKKVRFNTSMVTNTVSFVPGDVVEFTDERTADRLIAAGTCSPAPADARAISTFSPAPAEVEDAETAAAAGAPETAAGRGKGKKPDAPAK